MVFLNRSQAAPAAPREIHDAMVSTVSLQLTGSESQSRLAANLMTQCCILAAMGESAKAHNDQRWLTLVVDTETAQLLARQSQLGPNLRIVRAADRAQALWVTWEALAQGNSSKVIAVIPDLTELEYDHLANAAQLGSSRCTLINQLSEVDVCLSANLSGKHLSSSAFDTAAARSASTMMKANRRDEHLAA